MSRQDQFLMTLEAGVAAIDIVEAARVIEAATGTTLLPAHDNDFGGLYYAYEPNPPAGSGLTGIWVTTNTADSSTWSSALRPDLPFVARLEILDTDIASVGRLAARLERHAPGSVAMATYVIAPAAPSTEARELWRGHWVHFATTAAAAPRWRSDAAVAPAEGCSASGRPAPELLCHAMLGIRADGLDDAAERVRQVIGLELTEHDDPELGGTYREWSASDPPSGAISALLLRPNSLGGQGALFPRRTDLAFVLDVMLPTQNLLDLGRLVATIESTAPETFEVLGHRVIGDLVRDRVPRVLLWVR